MKYFVISNNYFILFCLHGHLRQKSVNITVVTFPLVFCLLYLSIHVLKDQNALKFAAELETLLCSVGGSLDLTNAKLLLKIGEKI